MQLVFKVTVEIPAVGSILGATRSYTFTSRSETEVFTKLVAARGDGVRVVSHSIDHIMNPTEAIQEIDEEMEMVMRSAYSEAR